MNCVGGALGSTLIDYPISYVLKEATFQMKNIITVGKL